VGVDLIKRAQYFALRCSLLRRGVRLLRYVNADSKKEKKKKKHVTEAQSDGIRNAA
jgi:hypothetical protein